MTVLRRFLPVQLSAAHQTPGWSNIPVPIQWGLVLVLIWLPFLAPAHGLAQTQAQDRVFKIGVLSPHDLGHEQQIVAGFREGIQLSGISHEFDIQSPGTDNEAMVKVLQRWSSENFDLIYSIGVAPTRMASEHTSDIPIVFAVMANPQIEGLVDNWTHPGRNLTGVSHWVDPGQKLQMFCGALPQLENVGVIYHAHSAEAVTEVEAMKVATDPIHITLHTAEIAHANHIKTALDELLGKEVDALWLPYDQALFPYLDTIRKFSAKHRLPVVSSSLEAVRNDPDQPAFAVAGLSYDYRQLGRKSVRHAIKILAGGLRPAQLPVEKLPPLVVANVNSAEAINLTLPPLFLADADRIISGFAGQKIVVAGTGDSQTLLAELARALEQKLNGGEIEIPDSIGSSGGIKALSAGRVDLARTARPLRNNETEQGLRAILFARSPVVFVSHPSVQGVKNIKSQDIVDIYSGRVSDWQALGGQKHRIYAVTRESDDSSINVLKQHIPGFSDLAEVNAKTFYSTPATIEALTNHRFTLGFSSLSAINNTSLHVLKFNNVAPSEQNVADGSYPLVVPFYIVYRDQPTGLAKAFIDFLFSKEGRRIILDFGAVPVSR